MKWVFVKVKDTLNNTHYPWLLKVDTLEVLYEYHIKIQIPRMRKAFSDTLHSKEYQYAANIKGDLKEHSRNELTYTLILKAQNAETNLITATTKLAEDIFIGQKEMLGKYERILIQPRGSYMPNLESHSILETVEQEDCVFPNEVVPRYFQWPKGTHWYAAIGNLEVVDGDNNNKWRTLEGAKLAAAGFLKKISTNDR